MSKRFKNEDTKVQPQHKYKGILHPPRASRIREDDLTVYGRQAEKKVSFGLANLLEKLPFFRGYGVKNKGITAEKGKQQFTPARRHSSSVDYSTSRYQSATAPRSTGRMQSPRNSSGKGKFTDRFVWNTLIVCIAVVVVSVIAIPTSFAKPATKISLNDGGRVMEAETAALTVGEFLQDNMISIGEDDLLEIDPGAPIAEGMEILIRRAMPVTVNTGQNSITVNMVSGTVQDALDKAGVFPAETDEVYPSRDTFVRSGMKIDHIVVTTDTRAEYREIPYEKETKEDPDLEKGKTEIRQEGETGEYEIIFAQVYKNGKLMPEEVQSEQTVKEPVTEITAVGTYVPPPPKKKVKISEIHKGSSGSSGGGGGKVEGAGTLPDGVSYQYAVGVQVTAYCDACNSGSSTASGSAPSQGTVAASLSQFPMGTKLFIPGYGYGRVEDTGGFGSGIIDVFLPGRSSCTCGSDWGRRNLTIYVLS